MATLTAADLAVIENDVAQLIAENPQSVAVRRGDITLPVQTVRVVKRSGSYRRASTEGAREVRQAITVVGAKTLDLDIDDRFSVAGRLYRVNSVHPDRRAFTQAEAELVQ